MLEDDDKPRKKPQDIVLGQLLDGISIADLEARIVALRAEIGRLEAEIGKRQGHRAAAEALFKRPPESR